MAKKKLEKDTGKTRSMLIRGVPEDLWTEVTRYCQDQGIHLREFMAQAMESLRGAEGQNAEKLRTRRAKEAVDTIEQRLNLLKKAEKLGEEIEKRGGVVDFPAQQRLQERTQAENNRLKSEWLKQMDLILPPADEAAAEGPPPSSEPEILERKVEESREGAEQGSGLLAGLDLEKFLREEGL